MNIPSQKFFNFCTRLIFLEKQKNPTKSNENLKFLHMAKDSLEEFKQKQNPHNKESRMKKAP